MDEVSESSEVKKETDFRSTGNQIIYEVVSKGYWRYRDTDGKFLHETEDRINKSRVVEIAHRKIDEWQEKHEEDSLTEKNLKDVDIKGIASHATNRFASFCVASEVIPREAVLLTSKLTKGSDVELNEEISAGLNIDRREDSSDFPQTKEERRKFMINPEGVLNRARYYLSISKREGIDLSQQQAITASIYDLSGHEWSHSLESAIETKYLSIVKNLQEYDADDDWYLGLRLSNVVFRGAVDVSSPALTNMGRNEMASCHMERFATGFEMLALKFGLIESGVNNTEATKIVDRVIKDSDNDLEDFATLRRVLSINDVELETLTGDIREILKKNEINESFIVDYPNGVGYFSGYSKEQLTSMVGKSINFLNETSIRDELVHEKQEEKEKGFY